MRTHITYPLKPWSNHNLCAVRVGMPGRIELKLS
jgi:hypothetical protein